jgi:hypothetical protein
MSTIAEIKEAIAKLPPREYCELMADLVPRYDDEWDRQMLADAESGKLDFVDRHVESATAEGTALSLDKGFEQGA